ncbi:hypothetical protein CN981_09490 [Priestia megaterium]|nr:hypothetical protein CN981_09490 [Priestia megaterium]
MEQKKYMDIVRLGHKTTLGVLNVGDHIIIQEKLDGANASFRKIGDAIHAFSRNKELSEENTLGGFYQMITNHPDLLENISEKYIFFGEWLNPHKVKYPEHQKTFFLYDIYDTEACRYLPFENVKDAGEILGFNVVPVFYEGEYISFEHLQSFVGRSDLGGMLGEVLTGEGIVVKNVDFIDRYGRQVFVKLVTDAFREVQKQKAPKDPKIELTQEQIFIQSVVTEPRIEKFLYKFVDEGILDEHFGIEDMGTILKNMNTRIYEDVMKEEADMLPDQYDDKQLRKSISRVVVNKVKKILQEKESVVA